MRRVFISLLLIFSTLTAVAQTTYLYAEKEGEKLYLDHYPAIDVTAQRPCVIFAFGGAFARGSRADKEYIPFFHALTKAGYDVVSIDYRKVLAKGIGTGGIKGAIDTMMRAVEYAAYDMLDATAFVVQNAQQWNIDPTRIVACGSSAGAITALQAENMLCNGKRGKLPELFNYGGVISFAGAIFSVSGKPKWQQLPCPTMLFHGDADSNVPYRKASALGVGFYGSKMLCKQFDRLGSPYIFYSARYRNHAMAGVPMYDNFYDIISFIERCVVRGEKLQIVEQVKDAKYPKTKTRFSVKEYLSTNYK